MTTAERVQQYIQQAFLDGETTLTPDQSLLDVLDSLQMLRTVMDLEKEYSIKVGNGEMTVENLGSVAALAALIDAKR